MSTSGFPSSVAVLTPVAEPPVTVQRSVFDCESPYVSFGAMPVTVTTGSDSSTSKKPKTPRSQ